MAKLFYHYGSMNASKSSQLIMVAFNYKERGQSVLAFKPSIDNRDSNGYEIKSRTGISTPCLPFDDKFDFFTVVNWVEDKISCILVDEAQFLTKAQVIGLSDIVDKLHIPVMCFGLRTNFKGELFEGSKWLMAYADEILKIKSVCWCGCQTEFNARTVDGGLVRDGDELFIGGNEMYTSLCRCHWKSGELYDLKKHD